MDDKTLDTFKIFSKTFKFFLMGLAMALVVHVIPINELSLNEVLVIAVTASLIYGIIDINYNCM